MATDLIRYDLLVQDAFRGLFRKVLADAAANGLPGDHHFYITFKTGAPGVSVSKRLREQYPDDMTIILQHQFWDLVVEEKGFEVGLSFRQIPEKLVIPFSAVSAFFDPSVNFGAEFTVDEPLEQDMDGGENVEQIALHRGLTAVETAPEASTSASEPAPISAKKIDPREKSSDDKNTAKSAVEKSAQGKADVTKKEGAKSDTVKSKLQPEKSDTPDSDGSQQEKTDEPTKVISFDAFRKKQT